MSGQSTRSTLDGLPKQFVSSMRTLFDIMDDKKTGYIKFSDIESRWREQDEEGDLTRRRLPKGVVDSLRKVTPPNGMLSFERFCAGLKICLLRNRSGETSPAGGYSSTGKPPLPTNPLRSAAATTTQSATSLQQSAATAVKRSVPSQSVLPTVTRPLTSTDEFNRRPIIDHLPTAHKVSPASSLSSSSSNGPHRQMMSSNTATVRPNTLSGPLRALSMPLLSNNNGGSGEKTLTSAGSGDIGLPLTRPPDSFDPCGDGGDRLRGYKSETKIWNANDQLASNSIAAPNSLSMARNRRGIMTVLHNWHMGMLNELENKKNIVGGGDSGGKGSRTSAGPIEMTSGDRDAVFSDGDTGPAAHSKNSTGPSHQYLKKGGNARRREPRRHTLANGIDYNMLKRMKQLEQEKDILLQGLEAVDKARAWYLKQIVDVQDKMKFIGHNSNHLEYSTEAHQERLNFQMAQIFEVNQSLSALVESSERGFPLHMNLALRQQPVYLRTRLVSASQQDDASLYQLKEINHLLTEEVSKKCERISQLEMEKAALVRELFQARAQVRRESDDTTLM